MKSSPQFRLFGSRARGTHRPDSDWDVLCIPNPPVHPTGETWWAASFQIGMALSAPIEVLQEQAVAALNLPCDPSRVDLFLQIDWGGPMAVHLVWDYGSDCWAGWLDTLPSREEQK